MPFRNAFPRSEQRRRCRRGAVVSTRGGGACRSGLELFSLQSVDVQIQRFSALTCFTADPPRTAPPALVNRHCVCSLQGELHRDVAHDACSVKQASGNRMGGAVGSRIKRTAADPRGFLPSIHLQRSAPIPTTFPFSAERLCWLIKCNQPGSCAL